MDPEAEEQQAQQNFAEIFGADGIKLKEFRLACEEV